MGKNLKGKECGKDICQRKDGRYIARFTDKGGSRRGRYQFNIQPIIGKMQLTDIKPIHCKIVLNAMDKDYAGSTIRQTYICIIPTAPK